MHEDYEYVKSLEKEVDEFESEKADFSNMYDLLLEECVSKDVICSYLHSLSELQCMYLHKVKECKCLAQKLSKQTESVNNEVETNRIESFSNVLLGGFHRKAYSPLATGKVDSTSFNGQKQQRIDINTDALYNEKQENLKVWLLKFLISKKPVPECSGLVLHQKTSDHNRSELRIHDHSNEPSSSKLVPKVVPLAVKTATS
ncbi:hypothetical protein Tco_0974120 [Tanacetum coccineum]|uniref:Uncharacterized protein n=1 Tax=Tanacetum coccineum TaxID=301880 RepID=A0ABQ5EAV6_9ASTR